MLIFMMLHPYILYLRVSSGDIPFPNSRNTGVHTVGLQQTICDSASTDHAVTAYGTTSCDDGIGAAPYIIFQTNGVDNKGAGGVHNTI